MKNREGINLPYSMKNKNHTEKNVYLMLLQNLVHNYTHFLLPKAENKFPQKVGSWF